ncbi:unnamed protein product [Menidia menidia]|uniref:Threonine synthase-like 2 n=1 Tax=Menidia menidia TaxID=238744 RepID=A0A8S4AKX8_9TELE|nr:unnamed protein product [Menidia menidia]
MVRYCSTRGGVHGWDFRNVLFSGYAPDGGMFMPETLPVLGPDVLRSWRGLTYTKVVVEVASLFIPAQLMPRDDLEDLVDKAFSGFSVPDVIRIARLKEGLSILELFHGDTLAFKDLAMTCTSGDTGGSAIQSAKGLPGLDVIVVYPRGRITPVQEKHMITCLEDNVHELVRSHTLMSLNSVNWSRVMIQLAHFIYAYLKLSGIEQAEDGGALPELEVVVPTGGAGNIAAGCIVKQMGLPLKLVAMVNSNDIVHRTVTTGDFSMAPNVTQTLAPAIDIQDPYNMERVFWLLLGRDGATVKTMMETFQSSRRHELPENLCKLLAETLTSGTVNDEGILETMRRCWKENQYVLCPHTAVAVWHHYNCPHSPSLNRCYIATASPAKFQATVLKAGLPFDLPEPVQALDKLPTRYQNLEKTLKWSQDWADRLKECICHVSKVRNNKGIYYN